MSSIQLSRNLRKYPPEMRERAIRLVEATIAEQGGEPHGAITRVARQLAIGTESLRTCLRQHEIDAGERPGLTTEEARAPAGAGAREPRAVPRLRDPQQRLGFLRGGARPPLVTVTKYIDQGRDRYGVEPICRTSAVAPSSYYAARSRPPSPASCATSSCARRSSSSIATTSACRTRASCGARCAATASTSGVTGWRGSCARSAWPA
jgi:transposase-like protein